MRSKFVVRFVDIVLILLFGFMAISRIQENSIIELPKSEFTPKSTLETAYHLTVGIMEDGTYLVEQESVRLSTVGALRAWLVGQTGGLEAEMVQVRIRSQFNAPVKYAMRAARVCDELGFNKMLDVEMKGRL